MDSLRSSNKHEPLSSSSEPPSPVEEDLAKASAWDDEATSTLVSPTQKGKGKQRDDDVDDEEYDAQRDAQYPPMAEEDLEARKVAENLKRWESLEKQRRKMARDSRKADSPASSSSSTFVEDVGRRASQLWGKARAEGAGARPHARTSGHAVLHDVEEAVPMEEPATPTPTPRAPATENPFESPEERDMKPGGALMTAAGPGSLPQTPRGTAEPERAILEAQPAKHPPPQPLGLPDPEEQARRRRREQQDEEAAKDKRWWTEWLCGCREHGDFQAGRTNPME